MALLRYMVWLPVLMLLAVPAAAFDRVVSIGESPFSAVTDASGVHGMLVDLIRALDRETHSSTKIVVRPFARSLRETAAGLADFHIPLIHDSDAPPPEGLVFVTEVDIGQVNFVIYSRKAEPLNAQGVALAREVEIQAGHELFFRFPVKVTNCVPCSLDKLLIGRIDALVVSSTIVDPLLDNPKYKAVHRALFKRYPVRALVPAHADSAATRRYLVQGMKRLRETGEVLRITGDAPYSDWQP